MSNAQAEFLKELLESGILIDMGVEGLYGRSGIFEDVVERFSQLVAAFGRDDKAEVVRFPPAMSRSQFESSGYMKSFPQLAGTIHSFGGSDRDHAALLAKMEAKEDWTLEQKATDVVLTPAAC